MDALTLDQIRVFLSVVDEGSFPKAAKSLQRAQSAVTYAIRKLEAEIGVPLFDRSAYRSVLTPAGRALLTLHPIPSRPYRASSSPKCSDSMFNLS